MSNRTLSIIMLVVGILIVVVVVLAGVLGIPNYGFGIKKIIGIVVGAIVFIAGLVMWLRSKPTAK